MPSLGSWDNDMQPKTSKPQGIGPHCYSEVPLNVSACELRKKEDTLAASKKQD